MLENSTLQQLELSENEIEDEGARAIADALHRNSTLRQLELDNNNIGLVIGTEIATTMRWNAGTRKVARLAAQLVVARMKQLSKLAVLRIQRCLAQSESVGGQCWRPSRTVLTEMESSKRSLQRNHRRKAPDTVSRASGSYAVRSARKRRNVKSTKGPPWVSILRRAATNFSLSRARNLGKDSASI